MGRRAGQLTADLNIWKQTIEKEEHIAETAPYRFFDRDSRQWVTREQLPEPPELKDDPFTVRPVAPPAACLPRAPTSSPPANRRALRSSQRP